MTIEIRSRWNPSMVLYTAENAQDVRSAVVEAVKARQRLDSAYLRGADLRDADLRGVYLRGADLRGAYLRGADLRDADLGDADLGDADLRDVNLRDAYLRGAYLRDADLRGVYLRGADLRDVYLRGADLRGADLRGADLGDAYLGDVYLRGAYLGDVLATFRQDLWNILDRAVAEVDALESNLLAGNIDGSVYQGSCACLVGTIANARHVHYEELAGISPDASRPAEQWFEPIKPGDVPNDAALEPRIVVPAGGVSKEEWDRLRAEAGEPEFSEGVYRATVALGWIREWREDRRRLVADLTASGYASHA